ncbi:rhodanese-like domain-containing protein [Salinirubrum litoreum]|uniref:Rhodanese-like domain-containing protein n=1 Tax=Salinirubrum litoreum TaxID=1126234 RepID=A0ABD5R616_9EURY|nr:rhodanese-like domain-containing protein [Salinirubrum litoreum]
MDGEIDPDEVADLLATDGEGLAVVDIRSKHAFDRGHIPDSVNIPFEQLPSRVEELADADRVVTVCPHGKASVQAARLVGSYEGTADATVESMAGGLEAWEGPVETSDPDGASAEADEGPDAPF